jgi:hypothetical protein
MYVMRMYVYVCDEVYVVIRMYVYVCNAYVCVCL